MVAPLSIQSRFAVFFTITIAAACSPDAGNSSLGSGGSVATGGVSSGGVTATGGAPLAGAPSTGGASTGGQFGSSGTAGTSPNGGSAGSLAGGAGANTGGTGAGGAIGSGGSPFGGQNQGGTTNTGGASFAGMAGGGRGPSGGSGPGGGTTGGSGGSGGDPFGGASVCTSKMTWKSGEGASMRPGEACIACHATNRGPDFSIAGTVYPTGHEPNDCNGKGNVTVVITDAKGTTHNLMANSVGNFTFTGTLPTPYTAKVMTSSGAVRAMTTAQTVGDCNSCHTEKGTNSAPGRIVSP
jgi:hypothetical protein